MKKEQRKAPILEAIQQYHESGITPFTTPGHKRGAGISEEDKAFIGAGAFFNDIPMQNGADDRRESKGVQENAEKLAAKAIGADLSFYSTNGSSLSAHVAVLTTVNPGDKILVVRNTHKSMIAAVIMANVIPVFLEPEIDKELDVEHGVTPEYLEQMLTLHPDAKAVYIVSPTYFGVVSDVKALSKACHDRNIPLVVDEAWGSHFPYNSELPDSAISCGADLTFGSIHKTMNGLGQAAILNIKGNRVDEDRFSLCFDLFESTSISSLLLASADAARRQMALDGEELWGNTLKLARRARRELSKLSKVQVISKDILKKRGTFDLDETKLTVDVSKLGITGFMAADWMLEHHKVAVELMTHRNIMALITVADTDETVDLLINAVKELHKWATATKQDKYVELPRHEDLKTELVMCPTKAFFSATKKVPIAKAAGEVIAEMVSPYPPGIPVLVPGELITPAIIEFLQKGHDAGLFAVDPTDEELKTLRVVAL